MVLSYLLIHSVVVHGRSQRTGQAAFQPVNILSNRKFGEWLSLVEHLVRDQGVGGSNPLSPTKYPGMNELRAM